MIIAVANQKGGVGKTTTAQALVSTVAEDYRAFIEEFLKERDM